MLGITTVGTAWCGYQASEWNGTQQDLARLSSDERVEGSRLFGLATQKVAYDAGLVAQYAQAVQSGNDPLAQFYRNNLVRPPFLPLLDQWEADIEAGDTPDQPVRRPGLPAGPVRRLRRGQRQGRAGRPGQPGRQPPTPMPT